METKMVLTANPSGTLWTASVVVMSMPNWGLVSFPKLTPMPIPSEKEWSVITRTISTAA